MKNPISSSSPEQNPNKRREQAMHKTDKFIETYKKAQPEPSPLSQNELRSILDEGFELMKKRKISISKRTTIMTGSSILAAAVSAYLLFNPGDKLPQTDLANDNTYETISNNSTENSNSAQKDNYTVVTESQSAVIAANSTAYSASESSSSLVANDADADDTGEYITVKPILINEKNAAMFGIKLDDNGYELEYESGYDIVFAPQEKAKLFELKYPQKGIYRAKIKQQFDPSSSPKTEIMPYSGWDLKKYTKPAMTSFNFTSQKEGRMYNMHAEAPYTFRGIKDTIAFYYHDRSAFALNNLPKLIDSKESEKIDRAIQSGEEYSIKLKRADYGFVEIAFPVIIRKVKESMSYTVIIWFADYDGTLRNTPTEQIVKKSGFIAKPFDRSRFLEKDFADKYSVAVEYFNKNMSAGEEIESPSAKKLPSLNLVELTDDELKKIGIYKFNDGYKIEENSYENFADMSSADKQKFAKLGYDVNLKYGYTKHFGSITQGKIGIRIGDSIGYVPYSGWNMNIADSTLPHTAWIEFTEAEKDPYNNRYEIKRGTSFWSTSSVANDNENSSSEKRYIYKDDVEDMVKYYSKSVPVHLTIGNPKETDSAKIRFTNAIVWLYCTPELLNKLPERYASRLQKELGILSDIESGRLSSEDACEKLGGEKSYLSICGLSDGVISGLSVGPNPAIDKCTCTFTLKDKRNVTFSLYGFDGNPVRTFLSDNIMTPGNQSMSFDLTGIESGMYFMTLKTDKGEMVFTKLIVR